MTNYDFARALVTTCVIGAITSASAQERSSGNRGVLDGIGDDVCAVMITLDLTVRDALQRGIRGADIWRIVDPHVVPRATIRAEHLGTSNDEGHLTVPYCYIGGVRFQSWHPEVEPVRIVLMVTRESYGFRRVELLPPVADVLATGSRLGVPPGKPFSWSDLRANRSRNREGYMLRAQVVLKPEQQ